MTKAEAPELVFYLRELDFVTHRLEVLAAIALHHDRPSLANKIAELASDVDEVRHSYPRAQEEEERP